MRHASPLAAAVAMLGAVLYSASCVEVAPSSGGGQTAALTRNVNPKDILLPPGYRIEAVAEGLTFPTGVAIDDAGKVFVVESGYSYGEVWTTPRLLRIEPDGKTTQIVSGDHAPWTGVAYHDGAFYIAQGGEDGGGRIVRVKSDLK